MCFYVEGQTLKPEVLLLNLKALCLKISFTEIRENTEKSQKYNGDQNTQQNKLNTAGSILLIETTQFNCVHPLQ